MSALTTAVEAAQPAVVADSTPAPVTTQEEIKQEVIPAKAKEVKKEESADAQVKQEDSAAKAEESADVKMEEVKSEVDTEVKKEESASKPAPLLKTKAPLKKDASNKKFDPSVLPVTDDPEQI